MSDRLTSRAKQALETKKKIQDAAFELFEEYGYDSVSMQEIANKAGCSIGNLYHYYKNKDALVLQFTDHVDEVYQALENEIPEDLDSFERLRWFVVNAISRSNKEKAVSLGFAHALKNPELGTLNYSEKRPYYRTLRNMVRQARADGHIAKDNSSCDIVRKILILQRGILLEWRIEEGAFDIDPVIEQMVNGLLNSLKA